MTDDADLRARTRDAIDLPRTKPGQHYDWDAIRDTYVTGHLDDEGNLQWLTLNAVAAVHGAQPQRVRERSGEEGWVEQRAAFQARFQQERQKAKLDELVTQAVELDSSAIRIAKIGLTLVQSRMAELGAQARERATELQRAADGQHADSHPLPPPVHADELRRLGATAESFYRLGREGIGDVPTTRVEVGGVSGQPIRLNAEVRSDEHHRIEAIVHALDESGILAGALLAAPPVDAGLDGDADERAALDAGDPVDAEVD